jgi:hypothetical protein
MNSYLVTKNGANFLRSFLPLTAEYHTLDTCIPDYSKEYQDYFYEVHPRLFRQKDDHTQDSELGNNYDNTQSVIGEFLPDYSAKNNTKRRKFSPLLILLVIILLALGGFGFYKLRREDKRKIQPVFF